MFLSLLEKYENEKRKRGERITNVNHAARFEFALWLEKNAAQQSVQRTSPTEADDPHIDFNAGNFIRGKTESR